MLGVIEDALAGLSVFIKGENLGFPDWGKEAVTQRRDELGFGPC